MKKCYMLYVAMFVRNKCIFRVNICSNLLTFKFEKHHGFTKTGLKKCVFSNLTDHQLESC